MRYSVPLNCKRQSAQISHQKRLGMVALGLSSSRKCLWIDKAYIADAHLSCAFGQASKYALSAGWHRRPMP
ncbi:hypothetical protein [Atopobium sp. oral taxon 416]|uniref:hypothetical protein n=1 Tax=Atopobium sp. oral taxon 416 TaxID=712157 RepID=UPI001BAAC785|nr:hypothetical protein [Atopobium sp. oral taxon 416]QUC02935.1 hypothetical protein J4859_13160 [Atopobium sp. oral taxon 416]